MMVPALDFGNDRGAASGQNSVVLQEAERLIQRTLLPLLAKMTINIYFIPAMSAEPERVFSHTKHTISD